MMKLYMKFDAVGRISSVASEGFHCGEDEVLVDAPEGFTLDNARDWRYVDGAWVYDPVPEAVAPSDPVVMWEAQNTLLKAQIQALEARGEFLEDCIAEMAMQVYGS